MAKAMHHKPILTAQALGKLRQAKEQILDATAGRVPERLVLATVSVSLGLAREEAVADTILPARVAELVRASLAALAQHKWKPDTALKLERPQGGEGHGISQ